MPGMPSILEPDYIPNDGLVFKRSLLKSDQKEDQMAKAIRSGVIPAESDRYAMVEGNVYFPRIPTVKLTGNLDDLNLRSPVLSAIFAYKSYQERLSTRTE